MTDGKGDGRSSKGVVFTSRGRNKEKVEKSSRILLLLLLSRFSRV